MQKSSYAEQYRPGELQSAVQPELTPASNMQQPAVQGLPGEGSPLQQAAAVAGTTPWAGFGATAAGQFSADMAGGAKHTVSFAPGSAASSSRSLHPPPNHHGMFHQSMSQGHMHNSRSSHTLGDSHWQPVDTSEILGLASPRTGSPPADSARFAEQNLARGLAVARIMDAKLSTSSRSINSVGSMRHSGSKSPLVDCPRSPPHSSRQLELQPWQIRTQPVSSSSMAVSIEESQHLGQSGSSKLRSSPAAACKSATAERLVQAIEGDALLRVTPLANPVMAAAVPAAAAAPAAPDRGVGVELPAASGSGSSKSNSASGGGTSRAADVAVAQQAAKAAPSVNSGNGAVSIVVTGPANSSSGDTEQQQQQQLPAGQFDRMSHILAPALVASPSAAVQMQPLRDNVQQQQAPASKAEVRAINIPQAVAVQQQMQTQAPPTQHKATSKSRAIFACCFGSSEAAVKEGTVLEAAATQAGAQVASPVHSQAPPAAQGMNAAGNNVAGSSAQPAGSSSHSHPSAVVAAVGSAVAAIDAAAEAKGSALQPGDYCRSSEVWGVAKAQDSTVKQQQQQQEDVVGKSAAPSSGAIDDGFTIKAHHFGAMPEDQTTIQAYNCAAPSTVNLQAQLTGSYGVSAGDPGQHVNHSIGDAELSARGDGPMLGVVNSSAAPLSRRMSSGRRFSKQGSRMRHTTDNVVDAPGDNPAQYPVLFTAPPLATQSMPAQAPSSIASVSSDRDASAAAAAAAAVAGWLQSSSTALPDAAVVAAAQAAAGEWSRRQSASAATGGGSGSSPIQTGVSMGADNGNSALGSHRTGGKKGGKRAVPTVTGWTTLQQQLQGRQSQQQQALEKQRAAERKLAEQQALLKQQLEALRQLRSRSPSPLRGSGLLSGSPVHAVTAKAAPPARSVAVSGRSMTPPRASYGMTGRSSRASVTKSAITVGDLLISPSGSRRELMTSPRGSERDVAASSLDAQHQEKGRLSAGPSKKELRTAAESLLQSLQEGTPMAPDALARLLSAVDDPSAAAAAAALAASSAAAQEVASVQQGRQQVAPAASGSAAKKKPFVLVLSGASDGAAANAAVGAVVNTHASAAGICSSQSHHASSNFKIPKGLLSLSFKKKSSKPPSQQRPKTYRAFYRNPVLSPKGGAVVKYSSFKVGANLLQPRSPGSPKFVLISPNSRFNSRRILAGLNTVQQQAAADADPALRGDDALDVVGELSKGLGVVSGDRNATNSSAAWSLKSQHSFAVSGEFTAEAADEETAGTAAPNLACPLNGGLQSPAGSGAHSVSKAAAAGRASAPASPKQQRPGAMAGSTGSPARRTAGTTVAGSSSSPSNGAIKGAMHATGTRRSTTDVVRANKAAAAVGKHQGAGNNSKGVGSAASRRVTVGDAAKGQVHLMSRESYLQFLKQQIGQGDAAKASNTADAAPAPAAATDPTQLETQQWQQQQLEQLMHALSSGTGPSAAAVAAAATSASGTSSNALAAESAARQAATEIAAQAIQTMLNMAVGGSFSAAAAGLQDAGAPSLGGCSYVSETDTPSAAAARAAAEAAVAAVSRAADARTATVKAEADAALMAALSACGGKPEQFSGTAAAAPTAVAGGGVPLGTSALAFQQQLLQLQQQQQNMYLPTAAIAAAQLPPGQVAAAQMQPIGAVQGFTADAPWQHKPHQQQLAELKWEKALVEEQQRLQEQHLKQQMLMQNQQQEQQIQLLQQQLALLQQQQQQQAVQFQPAQLAPMPHLQIPFQPQSPGQQQPWQAPLSPSQVALSPRLPLAEAQGVPPSQQQLWQPPPQGKIAVQMPGSPQPQLSPRLQPAVAAAATSTGLASPGKAASFKSKGATPISSPGRGGASGSSSFKYANSSGRSGMRGTGSFK